MLQRLADKHATTRTSLEALRLGPVSPGGEPPSEATIAALQAVVAACPKLRLLQVRGAAAWRLARMHAILLASLHLFAAFVATAVV